jgi:CRP/FNR family transcriptional regulator
MSKFSTATITQQHLPHRAHPCDTCQVRTISACASLDANDRGRLVSIMRTVEFEAHRLIFMETAPAQNLFSVTEGVIKIYKMLADGRRQITGFLFPGDFLGLIQSESYAYTAETVTKAKLCQFSRRRLEALLDELPGLEQRLLGMASHELAAAQDQMILLGRKTARERLASFLLMLSKVTERQRCPGSPVFFPMALTDVADYLGLTLETVSRTLKQFREQHLIYLIENKQVSLIDAAALYRISVGDRR